MSAPVRILQLVNTLDYGGATGYALTLSEHLDSDRYECYFGHGPGAVWEERAAACSVEVLNLNTMKPTHTAETTNTVFGDIVALWRLYCFLKNNQIQIIHSHGSKTRLMGGVAATLARVSVRVQSAHGFAFNSRQARWKNIVFTIAEWLMGVLHHELVLESKHDLSEAANRRLGNARRCIYTGIPFNDLDEIENATSMRRKLGITEDAIVVTMVGRVTEQKDPYTFVKTAHIVLKTCPQAVFLIVGNGDLFDSTEALIGDAANIRMLGSRGDVNAIIAASDIYLLCSRWEGIPLTILSAMYYEKPVIATNTLGLPEVVVDGVSGLLATEGDADDYARAVVKLIEDDSLRKELGCNGAELVKSRHSLDNMIEEFDGMYTDLVNRQIRL